MALCHGVKTSDTPMFNPGNVIRLSDSLLGELGLSSLSGHSAGPRPDRLGLGYSAGSRQDRLSHDCSSDGNTTPGWDEPIFQNMPSSIPEDEDFGNLRLSSRALMQALGSEARSMRPSSTTPWNPQAAWLGWGSQGQAPSLPPPLSASTGMHRGNNMAELFQVAASLAANMTPGNAVPQLPPPDPASMRLSPTVGAPMMRPSQILGTASMRSSPLPAALAAPFLPPPPTPAVTPDPTRRAVDHADSGSSTPTPPSSALASASSGRLGDEQLTRAERVARYLEKRRRRNFSKVVRYECRKVYADRRPRIKGRFVSPEEMAAYLGEQQAATGIAPGAAAAAT